MKRAKFNQELSCIINKCIVSVLFLTRGALLKDKFFNILTNNTLLNY